jgi:hypothetical protein
MLLAAFPQANHLHLHLNLSGALPCLALAYHHLPSRPTFFLLPLPSITTACPTTTPRAARLPQEPATGAHAPNKVGKSLLRLLQPANAF